MSKHLAKILRYRERAAQLRAIAKGIYDQKERKTLQDVAAEYDKLARAAQR